MRWGKNLALGIGTLVASAVLGAVVADDRPFRQAETEVNGAPTKSAPAGKSSRRGAIEWAKWFGENSPAAVPADPSEPAPTCGAVVGYTLRDDGEETIVQANHADGPPNEVILHDPVEEGIKNAPPAKPAKASASFVKPPPAGQPPVSQPPVAQPPVAQPLVNQSQANNATPTSAARAAATVSTETPRASTGDPFKRAKENDAAVTPAIARLPAVDSRPQEFGVSVAAKREATATRIDTTVANTDAPQSSPARHLEKLPEAPSETAISGDRAQEIPTNGGDRASFGGQEWYPRAQTPRPSSNSAESFRLAGWVYGQEPAPGEAAAPQGAPPAEGVAPPEGVPAEDIGAVSVVDGSGGDCWGCFEPCCNSGLIIGAEQLYIAPVGEPVQSVILRNLVNGDVFVGNSTPSIGWGFRTWAGLQRCGWGFRALYTYFENENVNVRPAVPVNAQPTFVEAFSLHGYSIDLELTQRLCVGLWQINTSFGGLYARLERNSSVTGFAALGNGVNLLGVAMGAHEIEGPGFTYSIGGTRPFLCWCNWGAFWQYRGSLLWANAAGSAFTEANAVNKVPLAIANSRDLAFASIAHGESVYISELQLGVQHNHCLCCIPANFFFRIGMEYQHWYTGDILARSNSFAFLLGGNPPFGGRVDAFANAHDGDLDLLGVFVHTGLVF